VRTKKELRDRATFTTLFGCGLRRSELANLNVRHVQQRDGRWCIVDLVGKHGRVRTIPMPSWVKNAIDAWTAEGGITQGHLFRPVNRGDQASGERLSEKVVWQMLKTYVAGAGLPDIAPHDLRRTTAKLCRAAGGELEQVQLLLGHSSVQTTERYLGTKQDLVHAPNDAIKLTLSVWRTSPLRNPVVQVAHSYEFLGISRWLKTFIHPSRIRKTKTSRNISGCILQSHGRT
jgi:integrase